jgi:hypothetical protein
MKGVARVVKLDSISPECQHKPEKRIGDELAVAVCHERERPRGRVVRNCLTDEGRPFGTGLQERVPTRHARCPVETDVAGWLPAMG